MPHLAIERWAKTCDCAPDAPVVLTVEGTHGPVIHAVTRAAAERGARAGARLTDARALDPKLVAVPADPAGDSALVGRLARWATRWSPAVEVDGADSLRLDVTGVAHLFGGEQGLIADARQRFAAMGLTAHTAIAPTAGAAWTLSHYGRSSATVTPAEAGVQGNGMDASLRWHDDLLPLPLAALRLEPDTLRTLERLWLKTIGALLAVPRLALARRFRGAEDVIDALDRLTGRKAEPLTARANEPPPRALLRLEEPVTHEEAAGQALERLIPLLVGQLAERHLGARRLVLTGFRVDGSVAEADVATSIPSREPKHLQRLLEGKAALDPGFGFDAFALEACLTEPLGAAQDSLVEAPDPSGDIARLVDRLNVKLGADKVRRPVAHESHVPERASGWAPALLPSPSVEGKSRAAPQGWGRASSSRPPRSPSASSPSLNGEGRPQRLLDRPEAIDVIYATPEGAPRRFVWRRQVHDIARFEGPERIAPEWWRERSTARLRDYYRIEDGDGRRYWIFREGIAGDRRGGAPSWFVHGLFG